MSSSVKPGEDAIREALRAGMAHHDAGRFAQAEAIYRDVLASAPDRPEALVLLSAVSHATGRGEEAIMLARRAVAIVPSAPHFHNQLGVALQGRGEFGEAAGAYRRALALKPDYAEALFNLGNTLQAQGRGDEAIACYRRSLAAQPRYAAASNNLGAVLEQQGRIDEALAAYRLAVESDERPEYRANFARCAAGAQRLTADPGFRALLARAIAEAWARPADLARTAIALIRGAAGLPATIDASALARDRLLLALLESAQVCEPQLERFLTDARRALLAAAREGDRGTLAPGLDFSCALARQCFLGDYVLDCGEAESAGVRTLRDDLAERLATGAEIPASWVATIAAYAPLGAVPTVDSLMGRPWPEAIRALFVQQVAEPRAEAVSRASVPAMTPVRDAVSLAVLRQYEENPYPRWVAIPPREPLRLEEHLRLLFPHLAIAAPRREALDVLVAGCGTGQESADIARQLAHARVLAIDLSRPSLAYAMRKSAELGIANIEFAQADILELTPDGREFDFISSVGVLHHLADPACGWRRLVALLRPGGFMQVGLYSEIARREVAAARAFIAERGEKPDPEGIRRSRAALRAKPEFARVTALRDFYGMNECRDLLFHVQEHRFTVGRLREMVDALGLEWIGLAVPPAIRREYARRFPRASPDDAACWDAFEREFPETFAGMYLLWVRKPGAA